MQRIGLLIAALLIATPIHAGENEVKVPFLFTDDQKAPQSDLNKIIAPSDALRKHPYLTGPMTRLEYMLTQMERRLNENGAIASAQNILNGAFERVIGVFGAREDAEVEGFARYRDDTGKVIVGYNVTNIGRPREPMRKTCEYLLGRLKRKIPQENIGYLLHNSTLGVLAHKKYDGYTPMLRLLATNIVHKVSLTSESDKGDTVHNFQCQREKRGGKIAYSKFSFSLPNEGKK